MSALSLDPASESNEVPESLMAMLDCLDEAVLRRLYKVLAAKLSPAITSREKHEHELGVLHEMLHAAGVLNSGHPRIPRQAYDRDRPEDAPRSARLVKRYGSWLKACRAAAGLTVPGRTKGAPRPWSAPHRAQRRGKPFTREEVIEAVLQCAAAVDRIPSSNVYYQWSARQRQSARQRGAALPRLPAQGSVERHFKSWGEVREAVMQALSRVEAGPDPWRRQASRSG